MNGIYGDPAVRARIAEYLGGESLEKATAVFLMESDIASPENLNFRPLTDIEYYYQEEKDISRSLWDRKYLIAHLDIEYVNFDFKAEPYLDQYRTFDLQQPVVETVQSILLSFGISPLHLISGRGHHFVWKLRRDSDEFRTLAVFGRVGPSLKAAYDLPHAPHEEAVPDDLGRAFSGLGLVMEYLAFRIKEESAPLCSIPVEITDVYVGPGERGREMISVDISEYGDPLHTRMIRIPFTVYRKPREKGITSGEDHANSIPTIYMIPLHEMHYRQAVLAMQDPYQVMKLARTASACIPEWTEESGRLIRMYQESEVKAFHDFYYSQEHHPPEEWPATYDLTPMDALPLCGRHVMENPNELLLKPSGIELVSRAMLALGWHPRHIAGLIRSRFERNFDWGGLWYTYDAATRADFYTRIFSGLFFTGRDDLLSFSCLSMKEKDFCFHPETVCELDGFRESLIARRKYERLACRPFNRLFLPDEHL